MKPLLRDDGETVGIIGGTGRMGRIFQSVFEDAGCSVEVIGRAEISRYRTLAERCGTIMVTVPIQATEGVIKGIAPVLAPDQLVTDLTSVKVRPVAAMMASQAQVIGLHPLFGPNTGSLHRQKMIMTPVRADPATHAWLRWVCEQAGMQVHESTPEEHDRAMGVMQGIIHLQSIAMAHTLRGLDMEISDLLPFATPNAHAALAFMARTLSQDGRLYGGILLQNKDIVFALDAYRDAVSGIMEIISDQDSDLFLQEFDADSTFSAPFFDHAVPLTDLLLDQVVKRW